ncbi:MAG: hypothetical protein R3F11_18435 [Verrucomicrobiales bacterium]
MATCVGLAWSFSIGAAGPSVSPSACGPVVSIVIALLAAMPAPRLPTRSRAEKLA